MFGTDSYALGRRAAVELSERQLELPEQVREEIFRANARRLLQL